MLMLRVLTNSMQGEIRLVIVLYVLLVVVNVGVDAWSRHIITAAAYGNVVVVEFVPERKQILTQ